MKHATLCAVALSFLPMGASAATVINFDDLGPNVVVGSTYAGVTFVDATTDQFFLAGYSAPTMIRSSSGGFQPQQASPIQAVFAAAASFVSLTGLDIGANGYVLKAFDAMSGGNLVQMASFTGVDIGVGTFQTLSVSGPSIWRVEFSQIAETGVGDGMAFDDFTYELAAVPVPASLPLMLAGLGGLGLLARRRKSS